MKRTAAATGGFVLFLVLGGTWVGLGSLLPDGVPRAVVTLVLATAFAALFLRNLISRIRLVLGGAERLWLELVLAGVNLGLMLLAFAVVQRRIGLVDATGSSPSVTHDFGTALYYSVVTFTTLGYGDYYPQGVGRVLAGLEAFLGYLVLGVLASTATTLITPGQGPGYFRRTRDGS